MTPPGATVEGDASARIVRCSGGASGDDVVSIHACTDTTSTAALPLLVPDPRTLTDHVSGPTLLKAASMDQCSPPVGHGAAAAAVVVDDGAGAAVVVVAAGRSRGEAEAAVVVLGEPPVAPRTVDEVESGDEVEEDDEPGGTSVLEVDAPGATDVVETREDPAVDLVRSRVVSCASSVTVFGAVDSAATVRGSVPARDTTSSSTAASSSRRGRPNAIMDVS